MGWVEATITASALLSDILFVVDNSCSMSDDQASFATDIGPLVDGLNAAGIDWRAAVTSTDIDVSGPCAFGNRDALNGRLQQGADGSSFVSALTIEAAAELGTRLQLGADGSGCEKGLGAVYRAIEVLGGTTNADFYREAASLHIVVLSDEEDQTEDDNPAVVTLGAFNRWMTGLPKPRVTFSAVVCANVSFTCYDLGSRYVEVHEAVAAAPNGGGGVFDLEDAMEATVSGLAELLAEERAVYPLAQQADWATLEVRVDGDLEDPSQYFHVETTNAVAFYDALPSGAVVTVRYRPL